MSQDPAQVVHDGLYMTLPLYFGESAEAEIIYQYANLMHNDGGCVPAAVAAFMAGVVVTVACVRHKRKLDSLNSSIKARDAK